MPLQSWEAMFPGHSAVDGTALSNSTTKTTISPTSTTSPDVIVPANFCAIGTRIRVTARGRWSQVTAVNCTLELYWGGSGGISLVSSGALALAAATNLTWELTATLQVRAIGTAGSIITTGKTLGLTAAGAVNLLPASAPAAVAVDTTTAKALVLAATGSNATNWSIQVHEWLVESMQ